MIEKRNLPKTVDRMEIIIVNFVSPAALNPFSNGPEKEKATVLNRLWIILR